MKTVNYENMEALYEETIKNLYRLAVMASESMRGAVMLEDKLICNKVQKQCEDFGRTLRINIFFAQDAHKFRDRYLSTIEEE